MYIVEELCLGCRSRRAVCWIRISLEEAFARRRARGQCSTPPQLSEDEQLLTSGELGQDLYRGMAVRARVRVEGAVPCRDAKAQQVIVVTQFESVHSVPLSSYPPRGRTALSYPVAVSRLIIVTLAVSLGLHGEFGDLERRVCSPALHEEWAAWHE